MLRINGARGINELDGKAEFGYWIASHFNYNPALGNVNTVLKGRP